jgi:hypothetical protein
MVVSSTYGKEGELSGEENVSIKKLIESYPIEKKKKSRWS